MSYLYQTIYETIFIGDWRFSKSKWLRPISFGFVHLVNEDEDVDGHFGDRTEGHAVDNSKPTSKFGWKGNYHFSMTSILLLLKYCIFKNHWVLSLIFFVKALSQFLKDFFYFNVVFKRIMTILFEQDPIYTSCDLHSKSENVGCVKVWYS